MDNKGFISIEYLFSLFIVLTIAVGVLFYASASISSTLNIEDSAAHRMILDDVANQISQVNANGEGYSKIIKLPSDKGYYELSVDKNKLIIEYDGKKGETFLPLVNINTDSKLISGRSYMIIKTDKEIMIK